jgi:tetratricopeptide (TPR) repeat protein
MLQNQTPLPRLTWLAAPLLAFAALLALLSAFNRDVGAPTVGNADTDIARPAGGGTDGTIERLQAAVQSDPTEAAGYAALGNAYYQRLRETQDTAYYSRAERAFDKALALEPEEPTATIGLGTLALARHDFRAGLELGKEAHRLAPDLARPYAVIADAQIELGHYRAAAESLDRLARLKPTLDAYARVSYYRELHGDLRGAAQAMRLAVAAGGGSAESIAYVTTLLGNLDFDRGRYSVAEGRYRSALAANSDYAPALAGLARVDAAQGALMSAIERYRQVVERLPLPEYAIALAEAEEAAGLKAAAKRDYQLVAAQARLLRSAGVSTDVELAVFEADHGDAARAVELGRRAWRSAPGVRSADAFAWALHAAGRNREALRMSTEAMRLGSRDPFFLYHAGVIAADAGKAKPAARLLVRTLDQSPGFSPLHAPRAVQVLETLQ